jgi:hypothetical protein
MPSHSVAKLRSYVTLAYVVLFAVIIFRAVRCARIADLLRCKLLK